MEFAKSLSKLFFLYFQPFKSYICLNIDTKIDGSKTHKNAYLRLKMLKNDVFLHNSNIYLLLSAI